MFTHISTFDLSYPSLSYKVIQTCILILFIEGNSTAFFSHFSRVLWLNCCSIWGWINQVNLFFWPIRVQSHPYTPSLPPKAKMLTHICSMFQPSVRFLSAPSFFVLHPLSLSLGLCHLFSLFLSIFLSLFLSLSLLFAHPSATIEAIEAIETVKDAEGKITLISLCVCIVWVCASSMAAL